jgi:uncharacterized protein YbaA (DUF1428 family)
VVNTAFMMGGALGLAVLASAAAARTASMESAGAQMPLALTGGYNLAFLVGAVFAALAGLIGALLLRTAMPGQMQNHSNGKRQRPAGTRLPAARPHREPQAMQPPLFFLQHFHSLFRRTPMARYVDGFIVAVPTANVEAYRKLARKAGKVWMEYGALEYVECIADDVKPGKLTSFPQSVKQKADETVAFSWITYKSRKHRDTVNAKVMADPRITAMDPKTMPFDAKRMIFGGFKSIVEL